MATIRAEAFPEYIHLAIDSSLLNRPVYRKDIVTGEVHRYDEGTWEPDSPHAYPVASTPSNTAPSIFDISAGAGRLYEYFIYLREEPVLRVTSNKVVAAPLAIPTDGYGYMFGNYRQPDGHFGEVLTHDDIILHYLKGLPQTTSSGEVFNRAQIEGAIRMAVNWIAAVLHIDIFPRHYTSTAGGEIVEQAAPEPTSAPPSSIRYQFDRQYRRNMADNSIQLAHRPVVEIHTLELQSYFGGPFMDLMNWHVLDSPYSGRLIVQPQGDGAIINQGGLIEGAALVWNAAGMQGIGANYTRPTSYANGYHIRYLAGFRQAQDVPEPLRYAIALATTFNLLDVQGDALLAGLSSISKSMDGMSESFSSTQSPTNAYYGARIGNYKKELEVLLAELRSEYAPLPIVGF